MNLGSPGLKLFQSRFYQNLIRSRNDCTIIGRSDNRDGIRIPTISFRFDGMDASEVCKINDDEKIAIRFGDFHSRRLAEYLDVTDHGGMVRVSMVHYNTVEEVDRLTAAFDRMLNAGKSAAAAR